MSYNTNSLAHELDEQNVERSFSGMSSRILSPLKSESSSARSSIAIIPRVAQGIIQGDSRQEGDYKFTVTEAPEPQLLLTPAFSQAMATPSQTFDAHPTFVIAYNPRVKGDEGYDVEEDVSEKIVEQINDRIGHTGDRELGRKLIDKMRAIAGMNIIEGNPRLDIPSARRGLCLLAGLDDQENKLYALQSLLDLIQNDPVSKASSVKLVSLAIMLLKRMDRDLLQAETVDVQIKIAQIYYALTNLLHKHYERKHSNAITGELKLELANAAKSLANLNRQEDPKIKFHGNCALQGVRGLMDDKNQLFDLVKRIYHAGAAAAAFAMNDGQSGFPQFERIFRDLDPHLPNSWFTALLVLKQLAHDAKGDPEKLAIAQALIFTKYKTLNWKFTYGAVMVLFDLCMNGETEEIRKRAFSGIKPLGMPGLATFANCKDLPRYTDMKAVKHFNRPKKVDPNNRIRAICAEVLQELAENAPDECIREKAEALLNRRMEHESDEYVRESLEPEADYDSLPPTARAA